MSRDRLPITRRLLSCEAADSAAIGVRRRRTAEAIVEMAGELWQKQSGGVAMTYGGSCHVFILSNDIKAA